MSQQRLITELSNFSETDQKRWFHHALLLNFIEPQPDFYRTSPISYIKELCEEANDEFRYKLISSLYQLFLEYINSLKNEQNTETIAELTNRIYLMTLTFSSIKSFRDYKLPITSILFKERSLLINNSYGTLSLYGLLLNLLVLWSEGNEGEVLKNDDGESLAITRFFNREVDNGGIQLNKQLDIVLVGFKYFGSRRSISDFFNFFEKFSIINTIELNDRADVLAKVFFFLCDTKKKMGPDIMYYVFHGFIDWYINSSASKQLQNRLASLIVERLKEYHLEVDSFYTMQLLLGEFDTSMATTLFTSINGMYIFRLSNRDEGNPLSISLYAAIHYYFLNVRDNQPGRFKESKKKGKKGKKEKNNKSAKYNPIMDDLKQAASGVISFNHYE